MFKVYTLILVSVFLSAAPALAHGLVTTQAQTVGDYRIEFEYNTLGDIFAGDYTIYDTYLLRATDGQPEDFDSVFIRIQKKDGPAVLAATLAESADTKGYASMSSVIQDAGIYQAEVDFYKNGSRLAQGQFDFNVAQPSLTSTSNHSKLNEFLWPLAVFFSGLVVGFGANLWHKSRKKI